MSAKSESDDRPRTVITRGVNVGSGVLCHDICLVARLIDAVGQRKAAELLDAIRDDADTEEHHAEPPLPQFAGFDDWPHLPSGF